MVDINLFEEDEKSKKKDGESSSNSRKEHKDDQIKEDLGFGDEISGPSELNTNSLLEDEETLPDFDESDEHGHAEDYAYGENRERKASPLLWILLAVVLIFAILYFFVLQPQQLRDLLPKKKVIPKERPKTVAIQPRTDQPESTLVVPSSAVPGPGQLLAKADSIRVGWSSSVVAMVNAAKTVVEDLSKEDQFGAVLITGDRFFVEYISAKSGASLAMGQRIQTLIGSTALTFSPEERHRTAGSFHYWGVVSGELPGKIPGGILTITQRYPSADFFNEKINQLVRQYGLSIRGSQKLSDRVVNNIKQISYRFKIEGKSQGILAFLESLKGFQGGCAISKLLLTPQTYADFQAKEMKLVLDFLIFLN